MQDYSISLKVRDYECDMQGIVNNSVYMNYLEHARHDYLDSIGVNFKNLIDKEIYLVALKAELNYKKSLISGQSFTVTCTILKESKFKLKFEQQIINDKNEIILQGTFFAAFIDKDKKPILVDKIVGEQYILSTS